MVARFASLRAFRAARWILFATASCRAALGIDEPKPRPGSEVPATGGSAAAAGGAGVPGAGGTTVGGRNAAGEAGEVGFTGGQGGEGGESGESGGAGPAGSGGSSGGGGTESAGGNANVGGAGDGGATAGDGGAGPLCSPNAIRCDAYQPQRCNDGVWEDEGNECDGWCQGGVCREATSCGAETSTIPCLAGANCCDTIWIPSGTYQMGKGNEEDPDLAYERTVRGFYLDRFEVTVGRFAAFVARYAPPAEGAGANPHAPMSGWHESWEDAPDFDHSGETAVPPSREALELQLGGAEHCPASTWNTTDQTLPINCVNWYVAFAFCTFDGGRLPTEAEWNYAAAFGSEQRPYPWSQSISDLTIDTTYAVYFQYPDPLLDLPLHVGSRPKGQGGFHRNMGQGLEDLAGNVTEWLADQWVDAPAASCGPDCMEPWPESDDMRVTRGGDFLARSSFLRTGDRQASPAYNINPIYGLRCARDVDLSP